MDTIWWSRISDRLYRVSSGWVTLVALLVFVLFTVFVLPGQPTKAGDQAGDAGSPDLSLWYSPADLYRMAEAYGEPGRRVYIRTRFTFDLVWPLVYGVFLTTAISWLYARALPPYSRWKPVNLAPPIGVVLDYLENLSTSLVMTRYPSRTPLVDVLAPLFTLVKWVLVGGSFVLVLAGIGLALWRWIARRE
jgi:hypothetical protein